MLKNIFSAKSSKNNNTSENELQQAAAVLMLKVTSADGNIAQVELTHVVKLLQQEFGMDSSSLSETITSASNKDILQSPVEDFTNTLCASYGKAKRIKLLEFLWILAYVDDKMDDRETQLLKRVSELLELTNLEVAQAQENAESHLGLDLF